MYVSHQIVDIPWTAVSPKTTSAFTSNLNQFQQQLIQATNKSKHLKRE
jgi:hypothetical protein